MTELKTTTARIQREVRVREVPVRVIARGVTKPPPTVVRVQVTHIEREVRVSCIKSTVIERPLLPAVYHRGAAASAAIIEDW